MVFIGNDAFFPDPDTAIAYLRRVLPVPSPDTDEAWRMTWSRVVASGCGTGYAPIAPGTVASAIALLIGAVVLHIVPTALPFLAALAAFAGLWSVAAARVENDPGWVVIDEYAGQWLAMCGLTRATVPGLIAAFLIFRLLDITKPGPIAWADRQKTPAGIMADDIIAGAIAAGILWAVRSQWPAVLE